jgi:hypothetical protein
VLSYYLDIANNNNNLPKGTLDPQGFPHILHSYAQELRQTKSPLNGERLASVIGKKVLSIRGLASTSKQTDDSRMTPLQAAMMEGIDLNKMSALIAHKDSDSEAQEESSSKGPSTKTFPNHKAPTERTLKATSSKPTLSLYRYHPMSLLDGETLLEPPKFSSTGEDKFRLFASSPAPPTQAPPENSNDTDVLQRVYQEFQIHEERIKKELERDQSRLQRPKTIDPSIRRIAEFSNFMQKKALNQSHPRATQEVYP